MEALLALPGVGRKTANLVLSAGFGIPAICVDTHVHRITNRWGYVGTRTPEETETALRAKLPGRHWLTINGLLVQFGKAVCQPISPRCSGCPIGARCPRVGVGRHR
jgi:endonuclease-3